MKHILSVGAAVAALAFTTATGFAQTAGTVPNSNVPGSPGYSGSTTTKTAKPKMMKKHVSSNQPNSSVPGSNGYSGSGKLPSSKSSSGSGQTLNSLQMNRKSTNHNNPNSVVPGSDSYSGSAPKPART